MEILIIILDTIAAVFLENIIAHLANPPPASLIKDAVLPRIQPARRKLTAVSVPVIPEMSSSVQVILVQVFHAGVRNGRSEGKTQPNPAVAGSGMEAMRG